MRSIGNDIVDLNLIDQERTARPKFYSKILSIAEQEQYHALPANTISFVNYVWMLWSAKESVYKYQKRHKSGLVFSPTTSEIKYLDFKAVPDSLAGTKPLYKFVHHINSGSTEIFCQSVIGLNYIHTIAALSSNIDNVLFDVQQIDSTEYLNQSASVRKLLTDKLIELMPSADINFSKHPAGYPIILADGFDTDLIASFAHHGHYVAYAICKS